MINTFEVIGCDVRSPVKGLVTVMLRFNCIYPHQLTEHRHFNGQLQSIKL